MLTHTKTLSIRLSTQASSAAVMAHFLLLSTAAVAKAAGNSETRNLTDHEITCTGGPYGDRTYYYHETAMTWDQGEQFCAVTYPPNGHLASIDSAQENRCLEVTLPRGPNDQFWIGLTDIDQVMAPPMNVKVQLLFACSTPMIR